MRSREAAGAARATVARAHDRYVIRVVDYRGRWLGDYPDVAAFEAGVPLEQRARLRVVDPPRLFA